MNKLQKLTALIKASRATDFYSAIATMGADSLPTLYDLTRVWQEFYDAGEAESFTLATSIAPANSYFLCGEHICVAPEGHPAEGKIIHAKIYRIQQNLIVPSADHYAVIDVNLDHNDQATHFIVDFREENDMITPVLDLSRSGAWSKEYTRNPPLHILLEEAEYTRHLTFRQTSWHHGVAFTTADGMETGEYQAVPAKELREVLLGLPQNVT